MSPLKRRARAKRRAKSNRLKRHTRERRIYLHQDGSVNYERSHSGSYSGVPRKTSKWGYDSGWRGAVVVHGKQIEVTPGQMMSIRRRARFSREQHPAA